MPDEVMLDDSVPALEDENFDIEVMDDVPQKDDATLALEARIAELEAEKQTLVSTPLPPSSGNDISALAAEIAKMQSRPAEVAKPQMDVNALVEEVNKGFYDNPSAGVMKLLDPIVKSMQEQNASGNAKRDLQISKLSVLADESVKGVYGQYTDEIEAYVASKPASETVYREAIKAVQADHMEDIIAAQVNAKLEEALAAASSQAAPAKAPQFTNATGVQRTPPEQAVKKNLPYKSDVPKVKEWMMTQGINWNDTEDRDWAVGYLRDNGAIK